MLKYLLSAVLLGSISWVHALDVTLYINRDTLTINLTNIARCGFNDTPEFSMVSSKIQLNLGEPLNITVVNQDSLEHSLTVDGMLESDNLISGGSSQTFVLNFDNPGAYRYYSNKPYGQWLGASGVILVGYSDLPVYFWNLSDTEHILSHELNEGLTGEIPFPYQPELFFINGNTFPGILDDLATKIEVNLMDEIYIVITNAGQMDHVFHWHGFHVEIVFSALQSERVGWIKDTVPIKKTDCCVVKLTANQSGVYPVHDHNLIAVTNLGLYPGGMLTTISVSE